MKLLATGFNAHGQLLHSDDTRANTSNFRQVLSAQDIHVLFAGWSETLVGSRATEGEDYTLFLSGNKYADSRRKLHWDQHDLPPCSFGTHDSLLGCLNYAGDLYVMLQGTNTDEHTPTKLTTEDSPRIRHLAIDGTGKVCVIPLLSPGSTTLHPLEFECFGTARYQPDATAEIVKPTETRTFLSWFLDPSDSAHAPLNHHMLPGPCKQLVANAITFSLLNTNGQLFTWGDTRYPSAFGRQITNDKPAHVPHLATAAESMDTKIDSIVAGGTITAAKTDHRDFALIWGTHVLGGSQDQIIDNLQGQDPGETSLIQLRSSADAFPASVSSIGVGDGHVLVIDDQRSLWGTGRNDCGQLGLGTASKEMVQEWKQIAIELEPGEAIRKVVCGDLTSFVVID